MTRKTNTSSKRGARKRASATSSASPRASTARSPRKRTTAPKPAVRAARARPASTAKTAKPLPGKSNTPRQVESVQTGQHEQPRKAAVLVHAPARADHMPPLQRLSRYVERATSWRGSLPELLSNNWHAVATKGRTLIQALKQRLVTVRAS